MSDDNLTRTQAFNMLRLNRKSLAGVDYNPRNITPVAAKRLRDNLDNVGLVSPITVNHRTVANGWHKDEYVILSGHQRVTAIDTLEQRDTYDMDVAVVELGDNEEIAQNIFLNNREAQGEYDLARLEVVMEDILTCGMTAADMGFDTITLGDMFPNLVGNAPETGVNTGGGAGADKDVAEAMTGKKKGKKAKAPASAPTTGDDGAAGTQGQTPAANASEGTAAGQQSGTANDPAGAYHAKAAADPNEGKADDHVIFVFRDQKHANEFRDLIGSVPGERYFKGDQLIGWLNRMSQLASRAK